MAAKIGKLMKLASDFHLHSRYSRAVSKEMILPQIAKAGQRKGISLLAAPDWTHPLWLADLERNLEEAGIGVFTLKDFQDQFTGGQKMGDDSLFLPKTVFFVLASEIASVYSYRGQVKRIHNLVLVPSFKVARKINYQLTHFGANLMGDGRPTINLSAKDLVQLVLSIEPMALIIPAHIWTPWFSLYGAYSGFDSIFECFGNLTKSIYAVETGLSSDPGMNWQVGELDKMAIVSFSDAHSPAKIGREFTIFNLSEITYPAIYQAIVNHNILLTGEFFPEEGKYHYSGHRHCQICYSPEELLKKGSLCPKCGKRLTVGVASRVKALANRVVEMVVKDWRGLKLVYPEGLTRHPYFRLVPLLEVIAAAFQVGSATKTVWAEYERLINHFGSELAVLLEASEADLINVADDRVAQAIVKVRNGEVDIEPGFDGQYGQVAINLKSLTQQIQQMSFV